MLSKRSIALAAFVCVALATAGIAVATVKSGGVAAASATFATTSVSNNVTKTCSIASGDTYSFTRAQYTGTSTSADARLNGPMVVNAEIVLDVTTGVGALVGHFNIDGVGDARAHGKIEAALAAGQVSGMVRAHVGSPYGELFAGINGGFTGAAGFSAASLGAGASTDSGVVLYHGACVKHIPLGW